MTYSTGGLIQASDYNNFNGSAAGNVSGTLGTVYSTGYGNAGYGQTSLGNVSATGTVTATQWTTLVNAVNIVRKHQSGAGFTNIGTYSAGQTINATNDIAGNLTSAYTNRLSFAAQGATTTGTVYSPVVTAAAGAAYGESTIAQRTVTFASVDAARYFFNAGGQINFVITGVTNNDGTARSGDAVTLLATNFGGYSAVRAITGGGKTGTGGTVNINTGVGYYGLTASPVVYTQITSTVSPYTTDFMKFYMSSTGGAGSNGGNGNVINLYLNLYSAAHSAFNGTLNVTVNHRVDIVYPSTSYLTSTWGTPVVA
jgi:hypothetical protein